MHIAALILAGIGAVFAAVAATIKYFFITSREQRCTSVTDGEVAGFTRSGDMFYPVIRYVVDGRVYERRKAATVNRRKIVRVGDRGRLTVDTGYDLGQPVRVRYDPDRPTRWFLEGDTQTWTLVKIFAFVGAGLMVLGAVFGIAASVTSGFWFDV
jgi:hypothetical protein